MQVVLTRFDKKVLEILKREPILDRYKIKERWKSNLGQ